MTTDQIKLNLAVMTPLGKGVVVGWSTSDDKPYLVKLEKGGLHSGGGVKLIAGSRETLKGDGWFFTAKELTAIEEQMTEQTHYPDWEKLTPLPSGPRPDEKVGAKFVVVNSKKHSEFTRGEIIELIENDASAFPFFTRIDKKQRIVCDFSRLAPLPQPQENKVKKLVPFTDEFDWCEEGVLVMAGHQERYAVRAKGDFVWVTIKDKIPCSHTAYLTTYGRTDCKKVIHEAHRPLTNREFNEFMQDHKGSWMLENSSIVHHATKDYGSGLDDNTLERNLLFRFRGTEEWRPVTTELYEIAKELDV